MPPIAVYAGSFDPFTFGHASILRGANKVFAQTIVAIGVNSAKKGTFTFEERKAIVEEYVEHYQLEGVLVTSFEGLLIDYCNTLNKPVIIRGLRAVSDFEQEMAIADVNHKLNRMIQTVFIPAEAPHVYVSSSIAKEIARHTKDAHQLSQYVLTSVAEKLIARR